MKLIGGSRGGADGGSRGGADGGSSGGAMTDSKIKKSNNLFKIIHNNFGFQFQKWIACNHKCIIDLAKINVILIFQIP